MTYLVTPDQTTPNQKPAPRQSANLQPLKPPALTHWWIVITVGTPVCTYYFGPFNRRDEARAARTGYVKDLFLEHTGDISALVQEYYLQELPPDQLHSGD